LAQVAPSVAILGNHDYVGRQGDPDAIVRGLEAQGITALRNAVLPFAYGGTVGMIVGFDDNICGPGADVRGVVGRIGETKPQIALIHEPDVVESFPSHWAGVTLAGHIHGAQVRLSPLARVDWVTWTHGDKRTRYPRGWFTVNGNPLYVNRGIGVARLPLRFAARPEIALLMLVRDPARQKDKHC
jgi:predicted MPP superfamily phosphohydrolase